MGKAIPSHFASGLSGGYIPNIVEHYGSRGEAIDAMREFLDRANWDGHLETSGRIADGFVTIGEWEYAEVYPCDDPQACEVNEYDF